VAAMEAVSASIGNCGEKVTKCKETKNTVGK